MGNNGEGSGAARGAAAIGAGSGAATGAGSGAATGAGRGAAGTTGATGAAKTGAGATIAGAEIEVAAAGLGTTPGSLVLIAARKPRASAT